MLLIVLTITVTSHEGHGISNHWQLKCFLGVHLIVTGPLWRKTTGGGFPSQRDINAENTSMSWCLHVSLVSSLVSQKNYHDISLTHWGRVTHICVSKLTIIGSDNGLSPGRRQAIIWTNAGILLTGPLGTNFSEILIKIHTFSLKKMHLKMSSGKWQPFFSASMC